jgi:5'-deoxynucleotidase YfbR-like HD superfamily hydrolase
MSKEIAHYIGGEETMPEAWARLDMFHDHPPLFIRDLMQEIRASPKLKEQEYEKLLHYYLLLLDLIKETNRAGQGGMFLTQACIEEMTQAFPLSKETRWRERKAYVSPDKYDAALWTFMNDRLLQTTDEAREVCRTLPMWTLLPIDAPRSGSGGGKHSKGKGTIKRTPT